MVTHCSLWRAVIAISVTGVALGVCNPGLIGAQEGHWVEGFGVPGMDGVDVFDLIEYEDGVVACGDFTTAGGVACNRIAYWNGIIWSPLGVGLNDKAVCLAVIGSDLYAGGYFTSAGGVAGTQFVARWDGSAWHALSSGMNDWVYALHNFSGSLVAGGRFTLAGGQSANYVAVWDGQNWGPMGDGFTAGEPAPTVWCFETYNSQLVAGGRFSQSGTTTVNRIALWNGSQWLPLGTGVDEPGGIPSVFDLGLFNGDLIAGGQFQVADGQAAENLASWDGGSWHAMVPQGFEGTGWNEVAALLAYGDDLIIGGRFTGISGTPSTLHLARWDGSQWMQMGAGANDLVDDFLVWNGDLLVSGYFTQVGSIPSNRIARWSEPQDWNLNVLDVPDDQGGYLRAVWPAHSEDSAGGSPPVTYYELQRSAGQWALEQLVTAAQADSYEVVFETPDILTLGEPAPNAAYRVIARTTDPLVNYISPLAESYSIDNLPPSAPSLEMFDSEEYRYVNWQNPADSDFEETCVYRGSEPGFEANDPLLCEATQVWYQEYDLNRYWYHARSFDIHGNASEWSNEVVGRYPTAVPGPLPTVLRLYPNQPNPFNPLTTLRFDIPVGGGVRLEVYDVAGRLIRTLLDADLPAGSHQAVWDGKDERGLGVASGSYFARLSAGGMVETVRMGLVR